MIRNHETLFFQKGFQSLPLGDLVEERSDSARSLTVIVQQETVMIEAQVLVL